MNWTFLQVRKSRGRKENRQPSYIDLEVRVKRELHLAVGDTLNIKASDDNFDTFVGLSATISLLIGQTVAFYPGDKVKIRIEISSANAEIGIVRKEE
jgi:hypothetical protein